MLIIYLSIIIFIIIFYILLFLFTLDPYILKYNLNEFIKTNNIKTESKNIAITTLETRKLDYLELHNLNLDNYCKRHNYTYLFKDIYNNDLNLPIYWKKIQLVLELLNSDKYDYVMWMDSDTIICDNDIKLEYILNKNDKSIFIGKNLITTLSKDYNAGVFIIKNDTIGKKFLNDCIDIYLSRYECLDKGIYRLIGDWAGRCYEQGIMNELLKSKYKSNLYIVEEYLFMNNSSPITNIFILHLFSGEWYDCGRYKIFKEILNNEKIYNSRINQLYFRINSYNKLFFNYLRKLII
jgi:hypothetical protein